MGDIARLSIHDEDKLYKLLGINAELLIDHAWGWEPTEIATIKQYKPESNSISSGQVLSEPYDAIKGKLIVREMTELLVLDLVRKGLVTRQITLTINYDRESIICDYKGSSLKKSTYTVSRTGRRYTGEVSTDYYGRITPKHAHGTGNIDHYTSSTRTIVDSMMNLYDQITDPDLLIRRVTIAACGIISEKDIPKDGPVQLDLFTDYAAEAQEKAILKAAEAKERRLQQATIALQERFGKNAVLKGMNFLDGGTTIARNSQIGGHSSGESGKLIDKKRTASVPQHKDVKKND